MTAETDTVGRRSPNDVADPDARDAEPATPGRGLLGDSARIAVASALSRVTGLLRIVVAASVLGATVFGDLFVAVNVLPLVLYDVFAGSAISSILVPPLVRFLDRGDRERARRFTADALGLIGLGMTAVAAIAVLARPLIARALTAGVDPALSADAAAVAGLLLLLILPQLVLYAAIGVFVSVQHAHRRFLVPSAAPIVENLGLLATIAVAWRYYGGGLEVDAAPVGLVVLLAVGSGLSVTAHAIVQFLGARRALGSVRPGFDRHNRDVVALAGPARASFGWSTIIAVRQFALVVAAAYAGAGGVQAFEIATLAYFIPLALIGRPIASAALPRLAATGDDAALLAGYRAAARLAAWLAVPAGLGLVLLAEPLASLIATGRFDDPTAVRLMTYGLAGLGLGAAGDALFEVARQAMMAAGGDDGSVVRRGLVRSTWIRTIVSAIGIPAAVALVGGPALLLALGLVVSIGDGAALLTAHRALKRHPGWAGDAARHGYRILLTGVAAIAIPDAIARTVDIAGGPLATAVLFLAVAVSLPAVAVAVTGRGRLLIELLAAIRSTDGPRPTSTSLAGGTTS
ncbi:MAG: lipid II flippase MurJ [Actinomycetota bacterium]